VGTLENTTVLFGGTPAEVLEVDNDLQLTTYMVPEEYLN